MTYDGILTEVWRQGDQSQGKAPRTTTTWQACQNAFTLPESCQVSDLICLVSPKTLCGTGKRGWDSDIKDVVKTASGWVETTLILRNSRDHEELRDSTRMVL